MRLVPACAAWFGAFALSPGLFDHGPGRLVADGSAGAILAETLLALSAVIVVVTRPRARQLLGRSRWMWSYALPAVLLLALPAHYGQDLPLALYVVWLAASVFWQGYLTFGLLQSAIAARLPVPAAAACVAGLFAAAHAILLPARFAPPALLRLAGILLVGAVLATLRARTHNLNLLVALHLGFYYAFA